MKTLYVLDNGGQYSDHCVAFIWEDPDEWDDLEGLFMQWCSRGDPDDFAGVVFTTTNPEWRDPEQCGRASILFDPSDFDAEDRFRLSHYRATNWVPTKRDMLNIWQGWHDDPRHACVEWQEKAWPEECAKLRRKIEELK